MSGKTELSLLEKQGWIEPMLRVFLEEHPRLKKAARPRLTPFFSIGRHTQAFTLSSSSRLFSISPSSMR